MANEIRSNLNPQFGDPLHITLKKLLERNNSPATTPVSGVVSVSNQNVPNTDAFGRLRVSNPQTEMEAKNNQYENLRTWSDAPNGLASITYANSHAHLEIDPDGGAAELVHQTYRRAYYQPGKSQLFIQSFGVIPQPAQVSYYWEIGMGDALNGVFLYGDGDPDASADGMGFRIRGNISRVVPRSQWNVDKLDGTGPSGRSLTLANATNLVWVDAEWLGVGTVRCGFILEGEFILCHTFEHTNGNTAQVEPYTVSMNLPIRFYMYAPDIGGSAPFEIIAICGTIMSEGGRDSLGLPIVARRNVAFTTNNDANWYPILGIRLNASIGMGRYTIVEPVSLSIASSVALFEVGLFPNPTLVGAAPVWSALNQLVQVADTMTNGTTINAAVSPPVYSEYVASTAKAASISANFGRELRLGTTYAGTTPIPLFVGVRRLGTGAVDFWPTLNCDMDT